MVTITHEQNIICSKTHLDGTTHEQTVICRELFAGHVVGSWPMKRKKKMHGLMVIFIRTVPVTLYSCTRTFTSRTKNHGQQVLINVVSS